VKFSCLTVSREFVRKVALTINQYELVKARWGRQAADTKLGARGAGVVTTRPLERVEVDHTLCDVHLVDEVSGKPIGRPWLTLLVDHYSGAVLGYHLSLDPPSSASVIAALRHAIMPKPGLWTVEDEDGPAASLEGEPKPTAPSEGQRPKTVKIYYWIVFGIFELLTCDNARELAARHLRELANRLGISLQFAPVRTPWYKGMVERAFKTFNMRLLHRMPGTTLGKQLSDLNYEAPRHAKATLSELRDLIERYCVTIHNTHRRQGKWRSPNELFLEGIQRFPPRMPPAQQDVAALFARTEYRVIGQTGIQYQYLRYQSDGLAKLFHTVKSGTRVACSIDVTDLREIHVIHPVTGEYIKARCIQDLGPQPYSQSRHAAKVGIMRRDGLDPKSDRDLALAELKLTKLIATIASKRSADERRKEVAMYKRLERLGQRAALEAEEVTGADGGDVAHQAGQVISSTQDIEDNLDQVFGESL
jgi:putative transposase